MERDDEVWIDGSALLAAARSAATDPGTRARVATALSHYGHPNLRLAGRSTDREHLLRTYRRGMRSTGASGQLPTGTQELVQRLEAEADRTLRCSPWKATAAKRTPSVIPNRLGSGKVYRILVGQTTANRAGFWQKLGIPGRIALSAGEEHDGAL
jgi:hypothetical protein